MNLFCHSCQELVSTEGYYDAKYQPICYLCQAEWPEVTPLTAIDVAVKPDSVNNQTQTALDTYLNKYQVVFLNQQADMEAFFTDTQTMRWALPMPHSTYYQAELKAIALVEEQFQNVHKLIVSGRLVSSYPVYLFEPPGRVVNSLPDGSGSGVVKTVVSDCFWDRLLNNPVAQKLPWNELSMNPNCDLQIYRRYPQLPWAAKELSANPNLSLEWLQSFPGLAWDWDNVTLNANLTREWLVAFPNKPWDGRLLSMRSNFDISWLDIPFQAALQWSGNSISKSKNFVWAWVELYPQLNWDHRYLSNKVPLEYYSDHVDASWEPAELVKRPEFNLEFLTGVAERCSAEPDKLFCLAQLIVRHPELNLAWLQRFSNLPLDWWQLTFHKDFTWAWCEALPDKNWPWYRVATLITSI